MKDITDLISRLPLSQLQCCICLVCGDDTIYIDGFSGDVLTACEKDIDATIHVSQEDLLSILKGEENAVTLFTSGRISVDGDMTVAFKLKDIFG